MTASIQEDMILIVYNDTASGLKYYVVRQKSRIGALAEKLSNCYQNSTEITEEQAQALDEFYAWSASQKGQACERKAPVTDFGYDGRLVKIIEMGFLA